MTTMTMKVMAVVGCLFCACGVAAPEDKVDATTCKATFQSPDHIELCHGQSRPGDPYKCTNGWQGFVLEQLVIAPRSQSYTDCGPFHNNDLYGAQCMRGLVHQKEDFDLVVFDILDKVSGQNQIAQSTAVERFSLAADAAVGDKEMVAAWNSSAFVSFEKKCKPAYPDLSANEATMINMCTNRTVNESRVYLTLRNTLHVPEKQSMCRCTIRPTVSVKLLALDVRLQTATNHSCGSTSIKIESKDADPRDFECEGMSAWYGSTLLYNSEEEITLTLTSVSAASFPTAVWIEVVEKGDARTDWEPLTVSCEGFVQLTEAVPDKGDDHSGDNRGGGDDDDPAADAGADLGIILGAAIGGLFLFVIIIAIIVIVRRRHSGSYSGILPISCGSCCKSNRGDDQPNFYKPVAQTEPVYSEPNNPRPSTSAPPYTFPVDAKIPDKGGAVYAEPDPNGTLGLGAHATTPPPLPDSPPPGSPTAMVFPPEDPPPKPVRTFPRPLKKSTKSDADEEEYDHIKMGGKSVLKSPPGRDGQNNIIEENREGDGDSKVQNIYNRLDQGDDYSQIGTTSKTEVKDNIYDTTA